MSHLQLGLGPPSVASPSVPPARPVRTFTFSGVRPAPRFVGVPRAGFFARSQKALGWGLFSSLLVGQILAAAVSPGPFSGAVQDPSNLYDPPVPGFTGPDGEGKARLLQSGGTYRHPNNRVNPLFVGWASGIVDYSPAPSVSAAWSDPNQALGPVTGDNFQVVSLGDLDPQQMAAGVAPGQITLSFASPIRNFSGADLVLFENGVLSAGGSGVAGEIFGELGFVEVSSDGIHFARFPSRSFIPGPVGPYGTFDSSQIHNLVGKHANAGGESWGTPFDLEDLANHSFVLAGIVDLDAITQVRVVDIPGSGGFVDSEGHPIYDPWITLGSGGLDLEAVGVISHAMTFEHWQTHQGLTEADRGADHDPDGRRVPHLLRYAFAWFPDQGDSWAPRLQWVEGALELTFRRDERARDLIYQVQVSDDLFTWTTIAQSVGGAPTAAYGGHEPGISEAAASPIASVGVVRTVSVTHETGSAGKSFMRVRVAPISE